MINKKFQEKVQDLKADVIRLYVENDEPRTKQYGVGLGSRGRLYLIDRAKDNPEPKEFGEYLAELKGDMESIDAKNIHSTINIDTKQVIKNLERELETYNQNFKKKGLETF